MLLSYKNNEIMSFSEKWMKLEGILLSELSQIQRDIFCMFFFSSHGKFTLKKTEEGIPSISRDTGHKKLKGNKVR